MVVLISVTAASRDHAFPVKLEPPASLIAADESMMPWNDVPVPKVTPEPTSQNTF
jgi:hypothetical protein